MVRIHHLAPFFAELAKWYSVQFVIERIHSNLIKHGV
jgi:hypothetical protein